MNARTFAYLIPSSLLLFAACGTSTLGGGGTGDSGTGAQGTGAQGTTGACPALEGVDGGTSPGECTPGAPGTICTGTDCKSLFGGSQYEMTCLSATPTGQIPAPNASLGCTIIPIPTPSDALYYCCPCGSGTGTGGSGTTTCQPTSGDHTISLTGLSTTCTQDSDCSPVYQGNACSDCLCPNAAIATSAMSAYTAAAQTAEHEGCCGVNVCDCPNIKASCQSGTCVLGTSP